MTRAIITGVLLGLCIALVAGCTSSSGRTPAWDVNDNTEIYPTYDGDTGAVGVGVTVRFRRSTADDEKEEMFHVIDGNGDGLIDVCDWTKEGGSMKNFAKFLEDDDSDGDEKISWKEFQTFVTGIEHHQ